MPPLDATTIATALAAGAGALMRGEATEAIIDAYTALKTQLENRVPEVSIEHLEQMPDLTERQVAFTKELEAANAEEDPALERLAEKLITLMTPKLMAAVAGDTMIGGNLKVADVIGGVRVAGIEAGKDILIGGDATAGVKEPSPHTKEVVSSEQALGRIADAVRLNLDQLQLNMEQARRESSQFFRTTMIFSAVAFLIIFVGIGLMLGRLVTVGIVTTAASILPEAGALLLFNKDKELRKTIETYHGYILESQRVLTMIDLAETMGGIAAKDSAKEQILLSVLKITPPKQ